MLENERRRCFMSVKGEEVTEKKKESHSNQRAAPLVECYELSFLMLYKIFSQCLRFSLFGH